MTVIWRNASLIEFQQAPALRLRVYLVHLVARMLGVLVKVDGLPFGSSRNCRFDLTEASEAICAFTRA